ncbi:MAG: DNA-directed RNA polymerase subunit omega [Clostridiales bacterium]|jgi:DNA-directed RNA polymerase subunit omega|uniref:DNA-directed RNA polymerase subunit omega n=1 Tax=Chordicoccus furentiruminis TaxID=2709410 RepID=UPI0023A881C8|nr:DNA-directed RNA polymerase subunit omega [Chordicoccus furentiruminis]MCI6173181.1 DNA-directed RNA polymerase subunit omega [Clostridiales bacterium]
MMMHPSYREMMEAVNADSEDDTTPIVSSRYSIVMATAKRARQIVDGDAPLIDDAEGRKPLSVAVDEIYQGKVKILPDEIPDDMEDKK